MPQPDDAPPIAHIPPKATLPRASLWRSLSRRRCPHSCGHSLLANLRRPPRKPARTHSGIRPHSGVSIFESASSGFPTAHVGASQSSRETPPQDRPLQALPAAGHGYCRRNSLPADVERWTRPLAVLWQTRGTWIGPYPAVRSAKIGKQAKRRRMKVRASASRRKIRPYAPRTSAPNS